MSASELAAVSETIAEMNALAARVHDPNHRRMLEVMRDHYYAEVIWDVDRILATMIEPIGYRFHGGAFMGTDGMTVASLPDTRTMYEGARDAGVKVGPMREMRFTFGDVGIGLEAMQHLVLPAGMLANQPGSREDGQYLVGFYQASYFPFDPGDRLMLGEMVYSANTPYLLEPIEDAEITRLLS